MNKLSIFIVGVFALLISACSQPVDKISKKVDVKYAKALKAVGIDSFYLTKHFEHGQIGVCDSDFNILGYCRAIGDFYIDNDHAYLIDSMQGQLTESGWVVYVPYAAKELKSSDVSRYLEWALEELIDEKRKLNKIEKSWEE